MKCNHGVWIGITILTLSLLPPTAHSQPAEQSTTKTAGNPKRDNDNPVDAAKLHNPLLWHDPGAIDALDLYNGRGGKEGQPVAPFKFESENMQGTNPKFDARDANGTKWRVKLGDEARPEVVASRLLWAVGYFVNDDYVITSARVEGLRLERGRKLANGEQIEEARFEKKPDQQKKIGIWRWRENPFLGTREFNGLRVMMAVMNNWDLKDVNNAVYSDKSADRDIFLASDIGATFGTNGLSWTKDRSKGDVNTFKKSKFITHQNDRVVDFGTPAAPAPLLAVNAKHYQMRRDLEWIGRGIPVTDARWIGSLLKQLSHQQLVDAFRAGHFPADEIDRYVEVVGARIQELNAL
ncbi:hypothetical protein P8935_07170 [Telmatobacter sp. DSM 110680]|uniref:Secreted protein n=1 Tax=Telmatobacter sp. DSM 110680 TaxID=3036704 RepID=A0AAU7DP71_9BACT